MGRWLGVVVGVLVALVPHTVIAQAVETSPRPTLRSLAFEAKYNPSPAPVKSLRPKLRPKTVGLSETSAVVQKVVVEQTITQDTIARDVKTQKLTKATSVSVRSSEAATGLVRATSVFAVAQSLRPKARPKKLRVAILDQKPGKAKKPVKYGKKGSVCGVRGIRGYSVKRVTGRGGCGIKNPVKITEVDGVKLTREALIGCNTAKALYGWVQQKAKPTVGRKGGGLAKIQMIAGYACRNRNSAKSGRLSEHAKGNAVDIAGFALKDGTTMSVLKGWRSRAHGPTLKRLHKTACGPFKTVLGPNSNRFHQDHFHFDVAQHRGGGTYCR